MMDDNTILTIQVQKYFPSHLLIKHTFYVGIIVPHIVYGWNVQISIGF